MHDTGYSIHNRYVTVASAKCEACKHSSVMSTNRGDNSISCAASVAPMELQLHDVAQLARAQRAERRLPRLDCVRHARTNVELDFVRQHPEALFECEVRIVMVVRLPPDFPRESPVIACVEGGEHLPASLIENDQLSLAWLHHGWPESYTFLEFVHDVLKRLDELQRALVLCESSLLPPEPLSPSRPMPSAPTLYESTDLLAPPSSSRGIDFMCKWCDSQWQFRTRMPQSLVELKAALVAHVPGLKDHAQFQLAEFNSCRSGLILQSDKHWNEIVASKPTTLYILIKTSQPVAKPKEMDLLGLDDGHRPASPPRSMLRVPPPSALAVPTSNLEFSSNVRCISWGELEVGGIIGNGSSCRVYKAQWRGTDAAVKVFTGTDRSAVEKEFANEVNMMTRLGPHPSLVLLLAITKQPLSLVFEYLPFSLFELINGVEDRSRKIPPFPSSWTKRVTMMLDIAKGLQFLHSFSIIHRDMKSLNLLVTPEGRVKLADFGISRIDKQSDVMTGCCGTYQWMAPEVLQSMAYSVSADIYSLGVIMWEICEAAAPFAGMPPAMVPVAVIRDKKRPPFSPRTPPQLKDLIRSCWQENLAMRPSARQATELLQAFFH